MKKTHYTGPFRASLAAVGLMALGSGTLVFSATANAALLGRLPATPGGTDYRAYYDTTLDITWIADANLAASNTFGLAYNTNLGDHPNDGYAANYTEQILTNGRMRWGAALHWIDAMNASDGGAGYLGFSDWRLPDVLQPDPSCSKQSGSVRYGYNCTGSEMGSLFYDTLGVGAGSSILTGNVTELAKFTNIQSFKYWSGVEFAPTIGNAWGFNTYDGFQNSSTKNSSLYGWAVRSGDVSAVPVPAAVWLFGSGLMGLLGMAKRKR